MRASSLFLYSMVAGLTATAIIGTARERSIVAGHRAPASFSLGVSPARNDLWRAAPPVAWTSGRDVISILTEDRSNKAMEKASSEGDAVYLGNPPNAIAAPVQAVAAPTPEPMLPHPASITRREVSKARIQVELPDGRSVSVDCSVGGESRHCLAYLTALLNPSVRSGDTAEAQPQGE